MLNVLTTQTLLLSLKNIKPAKTFLRDRYFATNENSDVFASDQVLIEYGKGNRKMAPFVIPRKGGISLNRDGYSIKTYSPPTIQPKRSLTIDDLNRRGFGEALYSNLTPQERSSLLILDDLNELRESIRRREENMAAQTLINNGCVMRHYADNFENYEDKEIRFYSEDENPSFYTPAVSWDDPSSNKLGDIGQIIAMLTSAGMPASDLIVAPDVGEELLNDERIQRLLDLRNYEIGNIEPAEMSDGVVLLARFNVRGKKISVFSYDESSQDEKGNDVSTIPPGHMILTAPGAGRTLYGAVTQIEQSDGDFHTYSGMYVPKYISDVVGDTREVMLTSRPIMIPNNVNPWVASKVLF